MSHQPTKQLQFKRLLRLSPIIVLLMAAISEIRISGLVLNGAAAEPQTQGPTGPRWTNSIGMSFVQIPAGTFIMGSHSSEAESHEQPAHTVTISQPFSIATTEVTQAQWKAVIGTSPSKFQGDDLPVERVSWNDAQMFIRKLNTMEATAQYRLPTEAEWEYACRAGTAWDLRGELDSVAWYAANSGGTTHPVAEKQANSWGLHDMLGNVYEWCEDWKGAYPDGTVTDPRGPADGFGRVVRGGSWLVHANRTKPSFRDFLAPDERRDDVGFRVVAVPQNP
jgi:formylglycine-generating enzyme required for sulfatase activity